MNNEISCRITNTFINYVKKNRPDLLDPLLKDLPYSEEFLTDSDNWIAWDTERVLEERLMELFQDEEIMFKVGQSVLKYKSLGLVNVLGKLFVSPGKLIKFTPQLTKYFTRGFVEIKVLTLEKNRAVLEIKVNGRQTRGACLYNQGIFSQIPEAFGYGDVVMIERQCVVPLDEIKPLPGKPIPIRNGIHFGAESCILELKWSKRKKHLVKTDIDKKISLGEAIKHLEENHAKLQKAYELLKESEQKYKNLMENAGDIIFLLNLDYEIYSLNKKGLQGLGYAQEEIAGRHIEDFLAEESKDILLGQRKKAPGDCTSPFEIFFRTRNSDYLLLSITCSPILSGADPTGIMLICRDITNEREMNNRLMAAEKFAAKGMLAAEIAHEINNSLANIETSLFIAKTLRVDGETRSNALANISEEIEGVSGIVKSILEVYRPNDSDVRAIDINDEIRRILNMLGRKLSGKGISVFTSFSPGLPKVFCYSGHIKQIFLNIIKNSEEALEKSPIKRISITSMHEGGYIKVIVEDTGPGISEDLKEKIFSPLYSTKPNGTGLGLDICQKLVSKYSGTIQIKSEPQKGTSVVLSLPASNNV